MQVITGLLYFFPQQAQTDAATSTAMLLQQALNLQEALKLHQDHNLPLLGSKLQMMSLQDQQLLQTISLCNYSKCFTAMLMNNVLVEALVEYQCDEIVCIGSPMIGATLQLMHFSTSRVQPRAQRRKYYDAC